MKVKLLTVFTDPNVQGLHDLHRTLDKTGWDHDFIQASQWLGFGTKLLTVYKYLQTSDIDAFFFADAYDVVALGSMGEAISKLDTSKITFSGEKNCWPDSDLEKYYEPIKQGGFNYLNSGLYFAPKELFLNLFYIDAPEYSSDDQLWATHHYLFNEKSNIVLDTEQKVFNSHSFIADGEYGYENGRIQINGNQPCLIHSNGRTVDPKLNELL